MDIIIRNWLLWLHIGYDSQTLIIILRHWLYCLDIDYKAEWVSVCIPRSLWPSCWVCWLWGEEEEEGWGGKEGRRGGRSSKERFFLWIIMLRHWLWSLDIGYNAHILIKMLISVTNMMLNNDSDITIINDWVEQRFRKGVEINDEVKDNFL